MSLLPLLIYTDGSCIPQSDKVNRRAGIGVWFDMGHPDNLSEPLPGEKQTSARAELYAVVRALEKAEKYVGRPIVLHSDSAYAVLEVQRILNPKAHKKIEGERLNGDLIKRLDRLITLRKAGTRILKVRGHSGHFGNGEADKLANAAGRAAYALSKRILH